MTNEELLVLATRAEPHTEEDRAAILVGLKSISAEEAHGVLLKVNEAGGENQRALMSFLADDTELYERIAAFVRTKFEAQEEDESELEESEESESEELDESDE